MRVFLSLAVIAIAVAFVAEASALVVEVPVTSAFLKKHPKAFSIKAEKRDDGQIQFTIVRNLTGPRYLVASIMIRKGSKLVFESHFPSFVREDSATYHFTIAPDHIANSEFQISEGYFSSNSEIQISERSFTSIDKKPVPLPGGKHYKIQLRDFAPQGTNKSGK